MNNEALIIYTNKKHPEDLGEVLGKVTLVKKSLRARRRKNTAQKKADIYYRIKNNGTVSKSVQIHYQKDPVTREWTDAKRVSYTNTYRTKKALKTLANRIARHLPVVEWVKRGSTFKKYYELKWQLD